MTLITVGSTHQTAKPPQVTRVNTGIRIRWAGLTIEVPQSDAQALVEAVTKELQAPAISAA